MHSASVLTASRTFRPTTLAVYPCAVVAIVEHATSDLQKCLRNFEMRNAQAPADTEPGPGQRSGESPGLSVAAALSWAVSHAEGRVTKAIGITLTTPIHEFATHTRVS